MPRFRTSAISALPRFPWTSTTVPRRAEQIPRETAGRSHSELAGSRAATPSLAQEPLQSVVPLRIRSHSVSIRLGLAGRPREGIRQVNVGHLEKPCLAIDAPSEPSGNARATPALRTSPTIGVMVDLGEMPSVALHDLKPDQNCLGAAKRPTGSRDRTLGGQPKP